MGLSIRAYARHCGVSHVAVHKALKAGRITAETDGTIDPDQADAAWERASDPARKKADKPSPTKPAPPSPPAAKDKLEPVPEVAVGSVRDTLKEQGLPAPASFDKGAGVTFVQARTAHEIAKAHLARLRLQEKKGELVDRARAAALVFRQAREERDAWANWPARTAALMAASLGVDPHALQTALEAAVRTHLGELADVKPDFR